MFISFEGLDGSGKTTQIALLAARLEHAGHRVLRVREPGGTALSERIRALLLDPSLAVAPLAELLLFSAARAQLVEEVIRPALLSGTVVLADRFFDSTIAYQGGGRGVASPEWLAVFQRTVTGGLVPERTFLLRLDPAEAYARRAARSAEDRMEGAGAAFFARVAAAYDALALAEPARFAVLDAARAPEALAGAIWTDLAPRLRPLPAPTAV